MLKWPQGQPDWAQRENISPHRGWTLSHPACSEMLHWRHYPGSHIFLCDDWNSSYVVWCHKTNNTWIFRTGQWYPLAGNSVSSYTNSGTLLNSNYFVYKYFVNSVVLFWYSAGLKWHLIAQKVQIKCCEVNQSNYQHSSALMDKEDIASRN
jgi:hypothetical protein